MTKPSGTAYYNYDNCGRLTSVSGLYTRSFTWDYEDRMTSGTVYGTTATNYTYNGVGTRTAKSGPYGSRTYKRDGVGVTAPVLSDGIATMVPGISEKSSSGTSTVHTDRLGSMKAMSSSGSVSDTAEYDAFGNVLSRTGSSLTQKGFAASYGYQEDGESGLKLLGHRYYDPETGRFISRDQIRDGRNWFNYCRNNPLKAVDASGLKPGEKYAKKEDAVKDACQDAEKASDGYKDGSEFGGVINQNEDGTWSYTAPETVNNPTQLDLSSSIKSVPKGATIVGTYHTHGYSVGYTNGSFSSSGNTSHPGSSDKYSADVTQWDSYMVDCATGVIRVYHPDPNHQERGKVEKIWEPPVGSQKRPPDWWLKENPNVPQSAWPKWRGGPR